MHRLVPKSPQLSRRVIQVLLGVGSASLGCLPSRRSEQDQLVGSSYFFAKTRIAKNIGQNVVFKKKIHSKVALEFHPVATIRLLSSFLTYMILGQVETNVETHQPEEQHIFSGQQTFGRTFGGYTFQVGYSRQDNGKRAYLNSEFGLVKGLRPNTLAGTMSLFPNKAGCWQPWMQQTLCHTRWNRTRTRFLFNPRLMCSALELSIANWRDEMEHLGLDLRNGETVISGTGYQSSV